jgi:hypothetical protein
LKSEHHLEREQQYDGWLAFGSPSEIPQDIVKYEEESDMRQYKDEEVFEPDAQCHEQWMQSQSGTLLCAEEPYEGWLAFGEASELSDGMLRDEEEKDTGRLSEESIDEEERARNAAVWEEFNKQQNLPGDIRLTSQQPNLIELNHEPLADTDVAADDSIADEPHANQEEPEPECDATQPLTTSPEDTDAAADAVANESVADEPLANMEEPGHVYNSTQQSPDLMATHKNARLEADKNRESSFESDAKDADIRERYEGWLAYGSPSEIPEEVIRYEEERVDRLDALEQTFDPDEHSCALWIEQQSERLADKVEPYEGWSAFGRGIRIVGRRNTSGGRWRVRKGGRGID